MQSHGFGETPVNLRPHTVLAHAFDDYFAENYVRVGEIIFLKTKNCSTAKILKFQQVQLF